MSGSWIGIGMLTFTTAELIYYFANNAEVICELLSGYETVKEAATYHWSVRHLGASDSSWYLVVSLALAHFSYQRNLLITIKSGLAPLFRKSFWKLVVNIINIVAVVATLLGVAKNLGLGVQQLVASLHRVCIGDKVLNA